MVGPHHRVGGSSSLIYRKGLLCYKSLTTAKASILMISPMSSTVSTVASICRSTTAAKHLPAVRVSVSLSPWLLSMLIRETLASSVSLMLRQYSQSNCLAPKSRDNSCYTSYTHSVLFILTGFNLHVTLRSNTEQHKTMK